MHRPVRAARRSVPSRMTTCSPLPQGLPKQNHAKAAERATRMTSSPDAGHFREDIDDLVAGEDPSLADDLETDAHGGQDDGGEDEDDLHQVGGDLDILQEPDAGVAEVAEHEGGKQLQQVMDIQHLAAHDHLQNDENDVHHPGESAEGNGGPFEVEDRGRTGDRSGPQVGFQGKRNPQGHQDETQRGDEVADDDIVFAHNFL